MKPNHSPTSVSRSRAGRKMCVPVGAELISRLYVESPIRWPSHAASTEPPTLPTASAATMAAPRYRRSKNQTSSAITMPAPTAMKMNHPSSAM
jgi:hypothetical protein